MNCSMPSLPVHHQVLEFTQTHVHWVSDAIQPSHPLLPPSRVFCLQSFLGSGSFPLSQLFESGGQSIGASASASVLPMNIQDLFPLRLTGLISLESKGLSRVFSSTTIQKHRLFCIKAFFMVQLSHLYMTTGETISLIRWTHVGKVTSLLFNTLSRFVIVFLPRNESLLISWL